MFFFYHLGLFTKSRTEFQQIQGISFVSMAMRYDQEVAGPDDAFNNFITEFSQFSENIWGKLKSY